MRWEHDLTKRTVSLWAGTECLITFSFDDLPAFGFWLIDSSTGNRL